MLCSDWLKASEYQPIRAQNAQESTHCQYIELNNLLKYFCSASDCESTDSSEDTRRGKVGRPSKLDKIRTALENNYRVSPRCHASTKSLGVNHQPDIDDLEEAYLFQDEKDLGLSSLPPYLAAARDENSNDSFSSSSVGAASSSKSSLVNINIKSLDSILQDPEDLAAPASEPAKVPPTRSRVSSDQLLSRRPVLTGRQLK